MAGNGRDAGRTVTSKVIAILMAFTRGSTHSVSDLSRISGLPLSTTHRIVSELAAARMLERDGNEYRIGPPLRAIQSDPVEPASIEKQARHVVLDLAEVTTMPTRLGILQDLRVAYIESKTNRSVSSFSSGATLPAHATAVGKALLAFADPIIINAALTSGLHPFTRRTLIKPDHVRRALRSVRLSYLACSDSELRCGLRAIAIPVFGPGGTVVAALELQVPDLDGAVKVLRPVLMVAAHTLSRELSSQLILSAPMDARSITDARRSATAPWRPISTARTSAAMAFPAGGSRELSRWSE